MTKQWGRDSEYRKTTKEIRSVWHLKRQVVRGGNGWQTRSV
jgi:hypothetical protein